MILSREPNDYEKSQQLLNAGWRFQQRGESTMEWFAPNCTCGQQLHAAWQSFKLGKMCEQPLVKEEKSC